jgi:hypothetical protein
MLEIYENQCLSLLGINVPNRGFLRFGANFESLV